MQQKSLRQVAKEIGVSASYLSQVLSGKKKASVKVTQALISVNQVLTKIAQPPSSSGLGQRPFTPPTRIRIPLGVFEFPAANW